MVCDPLATTLAPGSHTNRLHLGRHIDICSEGDNQRKTRDSAGELQYVHIALPRQADFFVDIESKNRPARHLAGDTLSDTLTGGRKRKRVDESAAKDFLYRVENTGWKWADSPSRSLNLMLHSQRFLVP